jgi:hypothetical protein
MDLRAERVTLNRLFGAIGEQFQVPAYQRPYAWGDDQIDDLWDDLISTLREGHFLGTIVLTDEDENRPQIIDGQQRLITLLLLLSLIRNYYHRLGRSESVARVQQFMIADAYARGDDVYRLRVGKVNWRPFRDCVLRSPESEDRIAWDQIRSLPKDVRARNEALIRNALRLSERLQGWLERCDDAEILLRLEELERNLVGKLQFVAIRVGTIADAFLLFETLNDRGLQLSAADLLKNHLLSQIAKQDGDESSVQEAAVQWDALLDDLGPAVDVTRFLRHYLLIQMTRVRKDDVFDRFKVQTADIGPQRLVEELRAYGKLYGEFEDPHRVEEQAVSEVLSDLKTLRAVTCYTALLPARRYLSSEDFVEFARLAEVLTYRYSTIVGLDSKELERVYHRAAKALADSKGESLTEARTHLIEAAPDTDTFLRFFVQQRMGRHYLVRYTLGRIEEHISPETERVLRSDAKLHIEHILPRTLNRSWREMLGERIEEHADYVDRWGNLTLLFQKLNIAASNNTFDRKKLEYRSSEINLTSRLCERERWTFDDIAERQEWLAEVADEIWSVQPFKESMQPAGIVGETELRRSLEARLKPDECDTLLDLCVETNAEELLALRSRVDSHLEYLLASDLEAQDDEAAREVALHLQALLERASQLDAGQRALARGAIEYFVLSGDERRRDTNPEGLTDDARVAKTVREVILD